MSEPHPDEWLLTVLNDGVLVPLARWRTGEREGVWDQFEGHLGGWFDADPLADGFAAELVACADRLRGLSFEQYDAVARLLFAAVRAAAVVSADGSPPRAFTGDSEDLPG
jgi:hypothetical protein